MSRDHQHTHRQESEDVDPFKGGTIYTEPGSINEGCADRAWQKFNILSLDGGGIRGYWSLLTLEKLMEFIAEAEEKKRDEDIYHSFHPQSWPKDVSQIPLTDDEQSRSDEASEEDKARVLPCARRYLPCHYFDNICGSSTGALIAIMLGRFRMTVPDCIHEYRSLGQKVFGKPRFFISKNFGVGNRHKYKAARLVKVFKEVTKRRNEKPDGEVYGKPTFPSGRGLCTTFVTTKKSDPNGLSGSPYLIRSYDHDRQTAPNSAMIPTRRTTTASSPANTDVSTDPSTTTKKEVSSKLNYGKAQEFEIWQVARAATAAPLFFEPLRVEKARTSGYILFTDGGFSQSNNPTRQAIKEIQGLHGPSSIGTVVSVGTARGKKEDNHFRMVRFLKSMAFDLSDPETIHDDIREQATQNFSYHRLNHPEGLDIELDRWEPKGPFSKDAGSETITKIGNAFARWACQAETIKELKHCAKMLVRCRWNRMNTPKWERYATGARYRCRFQGCDLEDFFDGEKFKDHLKGHGSRPEHILEREVDHCKYYWKYQGPSVPNGH